MKRKEKKINNDIIEKIGEKSIDRVEISIEIGTIETNNHYDYEEPVPDTEGKRINDTRIINISEENDKINYISSKDKKKHVNFFKQFFLPRVYLIAIIFSVILITFNFLANEIIYLFVKSNTNSNDEYIQELEHTKPFFTIFSVCVISPFIEELFFRRFIFHKISKFSKILAYIIANVLFAISHFIFESFKDEIYNFPLYFFMGVILTYTYDFDGCIVSAILSHMINNIFALSSQ